MSDTDFFPRWASPPGDTIRDALREQSLDPGELAAVLDLSQDDFDKLLSGHVPMTIRLAQGVSSTLGGSVEFWMTRDGQFRADQARVVADIWAQQMPLKDMRKLGWIPSDADDWLEQIDACLHFFDVPSADAWESAATALSEQTRFRSSPTFATDEYAVAAWVRQCEIELSEVPCNPWDSQAFGALLPQLLPLTRERDPQRFLSELRGRCAEVGVAVGVVRTPAGAPISGAAGQLPDGTATIALSGRHLADHHLWFTFFHEAAHLLLHGTGALYLDEIERASSSPLSADEAEADRFAGELLVPPNYEKRLALAKHEPFKLRDIASEIGVSPGIVVGHLQHRGVLTYNSRLNRLKRHYRWDGTSLEMA